MLNESELADFRQAASAALGSTEVLEFAAQRVHASQSIRPEMISRVLETIKPTAMVMWRIYKRTNWLPHLRFRGFVFVLSIAPGGIVDVQFYRETEIVTVE